MAYTVIVVGYSILVCVSTRYDFHIMTKLPKDAFLRNYPHLMWYTTVQDDVISKQRQFYFFFFLKIWMLFILFYLFISC